MVGRDDSLASAEEAVRAAAAGEARIVVVAGEAGVGKTRLVRELAARAADDAIVLWGDCIPFDGGELPYGAVIAALRSVPRELDRATLERVLGPGRRELARLLPELAGGEHDGVDAPAGGSSQARLFELLLGALGRLGEVRPVVLVLEDLHWSDRATRDLLRFLAQNTRAERLAVVLTYRTDEPTVDDAAGRLLGDLQRSGRIEQVALDRLSRAEAALQLEGILGTEPGAETVARVHDRAGGNPYFAEEVLAAGPDAHGQVPPGLRDLLLARVHRLSPDARELVALAAAIGAAVDHDLLRRTSRLEEPGFTAALRELVEAHVLTRDHGHERYRFRHALARDAVHEDLLPGERRVLHARVAAALAAVPENERGPPEWSALALHLDAAHDDPAALAAALSAAHAAELAYAFADAQRHLARARELWTRVASPDRPPGRDMAGLLADLAHVTELAGEANTAIAVAYDALAELDEHADPIRAARLHERLGSWHVRADLALPHFEAALALLPPGPSAERAAALISEVRVRAHGASLTMLRPRIDEALATARAAGAREEEARARIVLGKLHTYGGDVEAAVAHLRDGGRLALELGRVDDWAMATGSIGDALLSNGRVEEAVAVLIRASDEVREVGLGAAYGPFVEINLTDSLIRIGRWDEAERRLAHLLEFAQADADRVAAITLRVWLDARRGAFTAAEALVPEAIALLDRNVPRQHATLVYAACAELAVTRGDPRAACDVVERAVEHLGGGDIIFWPRLLTMGLRAQADLAEQARSLGDTEQEWAERAWAARLLDDLLGYMEGLPRVETLALHDLAWAERARVDGAARPDLWDVAAGCWRRLRFPYEIAYCRFRAAEARLAVRGERERAADDLRAAAAEADALGAAALAADVAALARRARVPVAARTELSPATTPVGHDLTPREVTVVERLARGRTNRQIAEELFLSRRTVDMHVRHILAKLHAANRVEAAGAAQRLGIVAAPDVGDVSPPRAEARARTRPGAARRTGSPAAPAPRLAGRK